MRFGTFFKIVFILLIAGVSGFAVLPPEQKAVVKNIPYIGEQLAATSIVQSKINLGLDLQGGTHLDYKIVTTGLKEADIPAIVAGVREIIERRVDKLGVAEPNIFESKVGDEWHIIVELAGIKDIEQAKAIVGRTIQLEFKEQKTVLDQTEANAITQKANAFAKVAVATPEKFEDLFANYEKKPEIALSIDKEWVWLSDVTSELQPLAKGVVGAVTPTPITGSGGYEVRSQNDIVEKKGLYVAKLLAKEAQATRTIEHEEERKASHILIAWKGAERADATTTRTETEAQTKAEEVLAKAKAAGADFAKLADENSDDPSAKTNHGDLGFFKRGAMAPAFEDATFDAKAPGLVDHIVRTSFGYHIIRLAEIKPKTTETKQEDRVKLAKAFFSTTPSGWADTGLTGQHFRRADVGSDPTTFRPIVNIYFTQSAVVEKSVNWWQMVWYLLATLSGLAVVTYGLGLLLAEGRRETFYRELAVLVLSLVILGGSVYGVIETHTVEQPAETKPVVTGETSATDKAGVELFADITKRNLHKPIAIFLDGEPIIDGNPEAPGRQDYAPTVQTEITNGQAIISGLTSFEEANQLTQNLNTGAIPAPVKLSGQYTIGATLGSSALQQSLTAGAIGLIVVMVFMILFYRLPGVIASIALAIYTTVTIFVIQAGGIVVTLAGVAGVILSIGMAVDANILIFERMKEELRLGKPLNAAIADGFDRAWTSIRDSNTSSLITCAILFGFGSSIIKGFALTLALGIVISLFTAITVTRTLLSIFVNRTVAKYPCLFGVGDKS